MPLVSRGAKSSNFVHRFIIFSYPYFVMLFVLNQVRYTWFTEEFSWIYNKGVWLFIIFGVYAFIKPPYLEGRKKLLIEAVFTLLRIASGWFTLRSFAYLSENLHWWIQVSYSFSLFYVMLTGSKILVVLIFCSPIIIGFPIYLWLKRARFIILGATGIVWALFIVPYLYNLPAILSLHDFSVGFERELAIEAKLLVARKDIFSYSSTRLYEKSQVQRDFYIEGDNIFLAFASTLGWQDIKFRYLFIYDLKTNKIKTVESESLGRGMGIRGLFSNPSFDYVYFTLWSGFEPNIVRLNKNTLTAELLVSLSDLKKSAPKIFSKESRLTSTFGPLSLLRMYITPDERFLLACSDDRSIIVRVDLKTKEIKTIDLWELGLAYKASATMDIIGTPDGKKAYIAVNFSDTKIVEVQIDPFEVTDYVFEKFEKDRNLGVGTKFLAADWDRGVIYASRIKGYLNVYRAEPLRLTRRFKLEQPLYVIQPIDSDKLVGFFNNKLFLIDLKNREQMLLSDGFGVRAEALKLYGEYIYLFTSAGLWQIPLSSIYTAKPVWSAPIELVYGGNR